MTEIIETTKRWKDLSSFNSFREKLLDAGFLIKIDSDDRLYMCKKRTGKQEIQTTCVSLHEEGYKLNFQKTIPGDVIEIEYKRSTVASESMFAVILEILNKMN